MSKWSTALQILAIVVIAAVTIVRPLGSGARDSGGVAAQGAAPAPRPAGSSSKAPAADSDVHKDALTLISEYVFGRDVFVGRANEDLTERVRDLRARSDDVAIEFLIATLPDPIDSNARWMFDPMLDAIQRAAVANHYILDRFYIPDWDPRQDYAAGHGSSTHAIHEQWPGVVLFRRVERVQSPPALKQHLLALFLVLETATSGVYQEAMERALTIIHEWSAADRRSPVYRIISPTFSGSIPSLRNVIARFDAKYRDEKRGGPDSPAGAYHIVSGGATNANNRDILMTAVPPGSNRLTYQTTVLPDTVVLETLIQYIGRISPRGADLCRMALLVESNTSYGQQVSTPGQPALSRVEGPALSRVEGPSDADGECSADDPDALLRHALQLPFPLHISRLRARAQADRVRANAAAGGPSRFRTLQLDEPQTGQDRAMDQIPALSPDSTASTADLILATMLDAMKREGVSVVGLLATDTRDKVFLANQIAQVIPSVTLFTLESDLAYIHPDSGLHGMLVGSTYPLFNQTQLWVRQAGEIDTRTQFPTTNTEGVYNATIALLRESGGAGEPLDYRVPFQSCTECRPGVWLSVVGRDAVWPLAIAAPVGAERAPAMWTHTVAGESNGDAATIASHAAVPLTISDAFGLTLFLVAVVALMHVAAFMLVVVRGRKPEEWRWLKQACAATAFSAICGTAAARDMSRRRRYFVACFGSFLIVYTNLLLLAAIGVRGSAWIDFTPFPSAPLRTAGFMVMVAGWVLLAACTVVLLLPIWPVAGQDWQDGTHPASAPASPARPARDDVSVPYLRAGLIALAAIMVAAALAFLGAWWLSAGLFVTDHVAALQAVPLFERAAHPGNGVSPLTPLVLLVAPFYVWAIVQIRRLALPSLTRDGGTLRLLRQVAAGGADDAIARLARFMDSPTGGLSARHFVVVGIACAIVATLLLNRVVTVEPWPFSRFIELVSLLLQLLLVLSIVQAIYLWNVLRALLRHLDAHGMADAYRRLPTELLENRLSPRPPSLTDLERAVVFRRALRVELDRVGAAPNAGQTPVGNPLDLAPDAYLTLAYALDEPAPLEDDRRRHRVWTDSGTWKTLSTSAYSLAAVLDRYWRDHAKENFLRGGSESDIKDNVQQWCLRAEEFVALQVVFVIREVMASLVNTLFFVIVAILMMVAAQGSFPIQPRQTFLGIAWALVIVAVVVSLRTFWQMGRDPVLRRLSNVDPRGWWDRALITKVVVYAVIPLLTLFAAQFPSLGGTLISWLRPFQQAMP
jgi:hypothetical protein